MPVRCVACAWCQAELRVPAPEVGGYFVFSRRCRSCDGHNLVELEGAQSAVRPQRRIRGGRRNTRKITELTRD